MGFDTIEINLVKTKSETEVLRWVQDNQIGLEQDWVRDKDYIFGTFLRLW